MAGAATAAGYGLGGGGLFGSMGMGGDLFSNSEFELNRIATGKPVCEPHDSTGEPGAGNRPPGSEGGGRACSTGRA